MDLTEQNAKIFATYPRDGVSILQALGTGIRNGHGQGQCLTSFDPYLGTSIIGTALMVHSIFSVNTATNVSKPTSNLGEKSF